MGKQWKQWQTLFSGAPKSLQMVTAAMKLNYACSLEEKLPSELPGKPDQPRQLLQRQRHYFANKGPSSQGYVFPVVMYGCESWTIKKAEHRIIDVFELWCWRRLLQVPWIAKRSNQSILKEISLGCSLEGLMLKLKLQYLATWCKVLIPLKRPWCWERLRAGWEVDNRGWVFWMASPTQWTWVWVDSGSWWWTGRSCVLCFMGLQRVGHNWVTELNWDN